SELGKTMAPGIFGDNLTLTGLPDPGLIVGTRLSFDEVTLEVTAPRIPCNTLAQRMGDARFAKHFVKALRPGIYCRVIQSGMVHTGEKFSLVPCSADGVSTLEMFQAAYRKLDASELERFLAAPIDVRSRSDYEGQLAKLI
ncbi:MAG: MOSC domain-containing protein, partial [Pseudomonadales bacterium]